MDSPNGFLIALCALIIVGGMLFLVAYIAFQVVRGSKQKPDPDNAADSDSGDSRPYRSSPLSESEDRGPP